MADETTSLATRQFEPADAGSAMAFARTAVASRLLPRSVATPEAAFIIIVAGRELGLTAMQSLRSLHVIDGKPVMSADLMLALTKRSPECLYFRLVQSTNEVATYETHRRGEPEPTRLSFSMADAIAAGLAGKDPWKKFPAAMLRARCIAALTRAVYPDVMLGVYETDELASGNAQQSTQPAVTYVGPAAFEAAMAEATTVTELADVARGIAAAYQAGGINDDDRAKLADNYKSRLAAIREPEEAAQ